MSAAQQEALRKENKKLQEAIDMILATQEKQKLRVSDYLTQQFAEKESLKEECNRLQQQANNLLKELRLYAPNDKNRSVSLSNASGSGVPVPGGKTS